MTNENAPGVAQICHRLDGIPLAIELAAARVKALSAEQIASRLDQRFELLTGGSRTAMPRQQTLRGAIDWSYDLLTHEERALFRRLAAFAGGWALEAAEAVCGEEVLDLLAHLVDKSLVLAEEQDGAVRYRLLETLRQYAEQKLRASGEEDLYRRRHFDWCLALAEQAEPHLLGPGQAAWCARLERELDNLRAALAWSQIEPGGAELALRLAGTLFRFWDLQGHLSEGKEVLEALVPMTSERTRARANALVMLGWLPFFQGDAVTGQTALEEALQLSGELDYTFGIVVSLVGKGYALSEQGDLRGAARLQDQALAVARRAGDSVATWPAMYMRAETACRQGDYGLAAALLEEGLALMRGFSDEWDRGVGLASLARVELQRGNDDRARELCQEGLALHRGRMAERNTFFMLETLGWVASTQGQAMRAAQLLGAAEAARARIGARLYFNERDDHDRALVAARGRLSEAGFAAAWAEGESMSLGEAIEFALTPAQPTATPAPSGRRDLAPLTAREAEVALLVARGLKNRQIAESLVITEKIAAHHVRNILDKLDFHARAQIATWAVDRGLLQCG